MNMGGVRMKLIFKGCVRSRCNLRNLGKREQFTCIMSFVERYENLYVCDCA